ncbi:MAG: helix-turn-helix transcriptional regulator [Bacteroidota bacterium]
MNRVDRIAAILIHLQTQKVVRASELSERFNISLRTVYRDMKALEEAGVPIGSEAGKGYYLVEGYHLPPVMFSQQEATALLIGEKIVKNLADAETKKSYGSAMYKIRSVLDNDEKDFLENLSPNIEILHFKPKTEDPDIQLQLSKIQQGIVEKRMIQIDYFSYYRNELVTNRLVEPLGLCYYSFTWHLIGYCKLRKDYRDFRLDRIQQIKLTDLPYDSSRRKTIQEYLKFMASNQNLIPITLQCNKAFIKHIEETIYYYGYVGREEVGNNRVNLLFMNDSLDYVARWLLMCGDQMDIVEPVALKNLTRKLVQELQRQYL